MTTNDLAKLCGFWERKIIRNELLIIESKQQKLDLLEMLRKAHLRFLQDWDNTPEEIKAELILLEKGKQNESNYDN